MKTRVLWFTGLSGSGKTTIAQLLCRRWEGEGKSVMVVDGDAVRATIHKELDFTPGHIKENNRRIAMICHEHLGRADYILVPVISPFRESRDYARKLLSPAFIEVYVNTPLEECMRRDVKGLYKKALAGEIDNFIGIAPQTPYESPEHPEIVIDTKDDDPKTSAERIARFVASLP